MKTYKEFLSENKKFSNWVKPSKDDLELEYKIEYDIKPLKGLTGNAWPTVKDFLDSVKKAKVVTVTPAMDRKIEYRSNTKSKEEILSLIRGYASYPQYRNEKTIDAIYKAFEDNKPMKMPIVLLMPNGNMRIMGGNTRLDIAIQLDVSPKVLLVEVPSSK